MKRCFFQAEGARKIRYGTEMVNHTHLRQRLIKEVTQLESRIDILERAQEQKHHATLRNYREMILERLKILQDLFTIH